MRESHPPKCVGLKRCWEKDIGEEITGETWGEIIGSWFKVSREIQTRLINYKIINRTYWTPSKMARLGLRGSDLCWRCDTTCGTLLHMLYSCPMIDILWSKIITFINTVMASSLAQGPMLCILGMVPKESGLNAHQTSWCRIALITGCRIVLRHCKTRGDISFKEWMDKIAKISFYERLCYKMINRMDMKIWGPFLAVTLSAGELHPFK